MAFSNESRLKHTIWKTWDPYYVYAGRMTKQHRTLEPLRRMYHQGVLFRLLLADSEIARRIASESEECT